VTPVGAEAQLLVLAALFYLYDSSVLLYASEGLLTPASAGRWAIVYQPNSIALRGRMLFIPNVLLPHRPVFRLSWTAATVNFENSVDWTAKRTQFARLAPFVYGSAAAIFVLLPFALYAWRSDVYVLTAALVIYLASIVAGVAVVKGRERFGLSKKKAWSTAIECVLCPPFTINLIRRLSLNAQITTTLPAAGAHLLGPEEWEHLKSRLLAQQEEEIEDASSEEARGALEQAKLVLSAAKKET
jgi:hypothetical protein